MEEEVSEKTSFSGIPEAQFLDDVDKFMSREENDNNAQMVRCKFEEQLNKYRFMDAHLQAKRRKLKSQIPDIKSSLDIVQEMKTCKNSSGDINTYYLLSDQVYMKASVPPTDRVCLWLGANVMLEYDLEEAEHLLLKNHNNAIKSLMQVEHDLDFLRNQCTTTEVTLARVINWDVMRRRTAKEAS